MVEKSKSRSRAHFANELLAQGLAEEHRWVPDSGWITFRVHSEDDVKRALWLLRLSYLRFVLKAAPDPRKLFQQESEQLHVSPQCKALLEQFVHLAHSKEEEGAKGHTTWFLRPHGPAGCLIQVIICYCIGR